MSHGITLRTVAYDHPDAAKLDAQVQIEYQERYQGEGDATFLDPAMFVPPNGLYLLAYDASDSPVASGAWRRQDHGEEGYSDGDAEIKRMYVVPGAAASVWPGASWPCWRTTPGRRVAAAWSSKRATNSRRPSPSTARRATPCRRSSATTASTTPAAA